MFCIFYMLYTAAVLLRMRKLLNCNFGYVVLYPKRPGFLLMLDQRLISYALMLLALLLSALVSNETCHVSCYIKLNIHNICNRTQQSVLERDGCVNEDASAVESGGHMNWPSFPPFVIVR